MDFENNEKNETKLGGNITEVKVDTIVLDTKEKDNILENEIDLSIDRVDNKRKKIVKYAIAGASSLVLIVAMVIIIALVFPNFRSKANDSENASGNAKKVVSNATDNGENIAENNENGVTPSSEADAKKVFSTYLDGTLSKELGKFNFNGNYGLNGTYCEVTTDTVYDKLKTGILNTMISDFDSDGRYEMLVLYLAESYKLDNNSNTSYLYASKNKNIKNMLVARMYEIKNGKVTLGDELSIDTIFVYKAENGDDTTCNYVGKVVTKNSYIIFEGERNSPEYGFCLTQMNCYKYSNNKFNKNVIAFSEKRDGVTKNQQAYELAVEKIKKEVGMSFRGTKLNVLEKNMKVLGSYMDDNTGMPFESDVRCKIKDGNINSVSSSDTNNETGMDTNSEIAEYLKDNLLISPAYADMEITKSMEAMIAMTYTKDDDSYCINIGDENSDFATNTTLMISFDDAKRNVKDMFGATLTRQDVEKSSAMSFEKGKGNKEYICIKTFGDSDNEDTISVKADGDEIDVELKGMIAYLMPADEFDNFPAADKKYLEIVGDKQLGGYVVIRYITTKLVLEKNSDSYSGYSIKSCKQTFPKERI